jgi:hypothetical protein
MQKPEDFPQGDQTKDWCVHCARPDGSLQSYDEKLAGMSAFIQKTQGHDPQAARALAARMMARQPAWRSAVDGEGKNR